VGIVTPAQENVGPGDRPDRGLSVMSAVRGLRVASGVILLLILSFMGPCRFVWTLFNSSFPRDLHDLAGERYRQLDETLPREGIYGFRTIGPLKVGKNHELEGDGESIARYVIAQYVLAPRVLDLGRSASLVIRDDLNPVRVRPREGR
jgi:hypothetical protein